MFNLLMEKYQQKWTYTPNRGCDWDRSGRVSGIFRQGKWDHDLEKSAWVEYNFKM